VAPSVDTLLVAHCRVGFEAECGEDLSRIAAHAADDFAIAKTDRSAFVVATCAGLDERRLDAASVSTPPVFARSVFSATGPSRLTGRDRVTPLTALAARLQPPFSELWLETPDTNEGKTLSGFCRRISPLLIASMQSSGMLAAGDPTRHRLHLLFTAPDTVYAGTSDRATGSPWPMGIPRLRMPGPAPSRSTLKLAEAFVTFLSEDERTRLLKPGMRAVDLGAAPGGWTWQLASRGLRVTAVDNGPLKGPVASEPLVQHLRQDGLSYRPQRSVDWMVCDIVEQPSRIAGLVASWLAQGSCRRSIFNLKLPMKKRYDEVQRCEAVIGEALARRRLRYVLRFKQLYHDREEVTGYCSVSP